jgi:hypothetical protein
MMFLIVYLLFASVRFVPDCLREVWDSCMKFAIKSRGPLYI